MPTTVYVNLAVISVLTIFICVLLWYIMLSNRSQTVFYCTAIISTLTMLTASIFQAKQIQILPVSEDLGIIFLVVLLNINFFLAYGISRLILFVRQKKTKK